MRKPTRSIKGGRPFRLPRRRFARRALAAAFGWLIAPAVSHAAVYTYFGPSGAFGLWSNAGSWSPAAVPPSGSDVVLGSGNAASGVIFNQTYTTALNSLTINATIPATFTVVQNVSGSAMLALTETLGTTVYGNLYNQSAGTNTTNNLSIGAASTYANTYLLSGSGALYGTNETIGAGTSTGAFQQFGGTNTVNSLLAIGTMATTSTPSNVYNMTGGTLNVNGNLTAGSGSFQQSAGSTTITGLMSLQGYSTAAVGGSAVLNLTGSLWVGNEPANAGSADTDTYFQTGGIANIGGGMVVGNGNQVSGVMNITGGTLNLQTGTLALGQGLATATANQSGGNVTVGTLQIANGSSGTATWFLSGNTSVLTVNSFEAIGDSSPGLLQQSGGTHTLNGDMQLGQAATGSGSYLFTGGVLNENTNIAVGQLGIGAFNQTGGTANISTGLYLGSGDGSSGQYLLANGNLSTGFIICGNFGAGIFNQTGGNVSSGYINISNQTSATGTYNLVNGNLSASYLSPGVSANGVFNQSGGNVNISQSVQISFAGATGTYLISAGNLSTGNLYAGFAGPGVFNQTGGAVNASSTVEVAIFQGSTGTYDLVNGNLSTAAAYVGVAGQGTMYQSGGLFNASQSVYLGYDAGASGMFYLSAGTLQIGTLLHVGESGSGVFNQNGGTVSLPTVGGVFDVGYQSKGTGVYNLINGNMSCFELNTGIYGNGVVNQTGGNINVVNYVLGYVAGSTGSHYLSAGTLTAQYLFDGYNGNGTFAQTGGTVTVTGYMQTSGFGGSSGLYTLAGGSLSAPILYDGVHGAGVYNQSAGTANFNSAVVIGDNSDGNGILNLTGGNLSTGTFENGNAGPGTVNVNGGSLIAATIYDGYQASGVFNLSGGTVNVSTGMYVGSANGAAGSFALTGTGVLNLPNAPQSQQDGFIEPTGVFIQSSGTESGCLINAGTFNFSGGIFNGAFVNNLSGTANITGNVTFGAGLTNHGTMNVVNASIGAMAGQTLLNDGVLNITGSGQINSSGPILNNGTINAVGSISGTAGLTNNFVVNQGPATLILNVSGGSINYGTFNLAGGHLLQLYATLTNYGLFSLNGALVAASGGTLVNGAGGLVNGPGIIASPFTNSGTVLPGSSALNISSNWNNSGSVQLTGTGSTLTGGAISNFGTIQGYGTLGSPIANTGTIEADTGTLNVEGTLTNPIGGLINTTPGAKVLVTAGLAVNAGTISLTGGTFDNGNQPLSNTGEISGYGTFRSGLLTNNGIITFTGTNGFTTTINGNVNNSAGKSLNVQFNPAIFTGNVTNQGTILISGTTVTFAGAYSGNQYISDPSTNIFQNNVTVVSGGSMTGQAGDKFYFSGGTFTNNGIFSNAGLINSSDNAVNPGSFTQSGSQTWAVGTVFTNTGGAALFASDTGGGGANLTVNDAAGTVTFSTTQHLAALNIAAGATTTITAITGRSVVITPSLAVTGLLDLTTNGLDVQGGSLASVTAMVRQGYNGNGTWNGTSGITSSSAANDPRHLTAVGVIQNNQSSAVLYGAGNLFDGVAPGTSDILAKYTYYGDANLDGKVDGSDYSLLDNGYLNHLTGWYNGDFNYDQLIDGSDYTLIDNAFNMQGAPLSDEIATPTAQLARPAAASVPEPAGLSVLLPGVIGFLGRRNDRRDRPRFTGQPN